jgi:hypothetical protein
MPPSGPCAACVISQREGGVAKRQALGAPPPWGGGGGGGGVRARAQGMRSQAGDERHPVPGAPNPQRRGQSTTGRRKQDASNNTQRIAHGGECHTPSGTMNYLNYVIKNQNWGQSS